jgi:hypothetical protein
MAPEKTIEREIDRHVLPATMHRIVDETKAPLTTERGGCMTVVDVLTAQGANQPDNAAYEFGHEQFAVQTANGPEEELIQPGPDWAWMENCNYLDKDEEGQIFSVDFGCFAPLEFVAAYPDDEPELLGAFTTGFGSAMRSKNQDDKMKAWQLAEDERLANMGNDDDDDEDGGIHLVEGVAGKCEQCGKPFTPRTPVELEALRSIPWWDDIADDESVPSLCDEPQP